MNETERRELLLKEHAKIQKANKEGYAGCMPNGNLVDRREHPEAMPVAENPIFNVTKPRCVSCGNTVNQFGELIKSKCKNCLND